MCVCADPFICPDRKQRERMAELQERRRSLQTLLTTRLAELRHVCLQEAVSDVIAFTCVYLRFHTRHHHSGLIWGFCPASGADWCGSQRLPPGGR